MNTPIWQPSAQRIAKARLTAYQHYIEQHQGLVFPDYETLHRWSIEHSEIFWSSIWDFCEVIGDKGQRLLQAGNAMPDTRFFPDARLNFAENLLCRRDQADAMVFWSEDKVRQRISWAELYRQVSRLRQALLELGITPGDRVAGYVANTPQTVIAMLASASLGAIWSACSPDFGVQGVLDRFEQIQPKLLFAHDRYYYAGKSYDNSHKINKIKDNLESLSQVIIIPFDSQPSTTKPLSESITSCLSFDRLVAPDAEKNTAESIEFERFPFAHPLYILFSSGTTGVPKCIVHSAGGTLLQHLKEHQLHCDIKADDRVLYYTTCTWMMWNWLVSALASRATLLLYDGSPTHPGNRILFDYADAEAMTLLGTSAKFIDTLGKQQCHPAESHDLKNLRTITSTGSTLSAEHFDFVYQQIKSDVQLASISGGTDIISCFVLGNPTAPVYRGEITCRGLGMAVEVWDESACPVTQQKGELVCTRAFPSMPLGFWNDPGNSRYQAAYFDRFPGIWAHGDYAEITAHQGIIIHGRSDTTLNPGGVRIGSAEIYRQVEQISEVLDSVVIGQHWQGDERILLFVVLRPGITLDDTLTDNISQQIRRGASPRHVPARIIQVDDIPRTRSGKIAELAVKAVVEGRAVKNKTALANPESLDLYKNVIN